MSELYSTTSCYSIRDDVTLDRFTEEARGDAFVHALASWSRSVEKTR